MPGIQGELLWWPYSDSLSLLALTIVGQRLRVYSFASRTWRAFAAEARQFECQLPDEVTVGSSPIALSVTSLIVRRVRLADGHVEDLVNLSKYPVVPYPWVGVSRDGSPLLLRNLGSSSVYELRLERR